MVATLRALVLTMVATSCGRIHFEARTDVNADAATGTGDGSAAAACTPIAISDDFDSATKSSQWDSYAATGVTVSQGGTLSISLPSNTGGFNYGGYTALMAFDLRDHCTFVTLVAAPSSPNPAEAQLTVQIGATTNYIGFSIGNGTVEAFTQSAGSDTSIADVPYDAVAYRVLRLREAAGTLYYEYSPDGVEFSLLGSIPTPFDLSDTFVLLQAGTYGSATAPGTVQFDNLDL